jgi:hypothetical protein
LKPRPSRLRVPVAYQADMEFFEAMYISSAIETGIAGLCNNKEMKVDVGILLKIFICTVLIRLIPSLHP